MGETVIVNEVGLRDGLQNQPRLVPLEGKLELVKALLDAGVRHFEATSFVSPKLVPQMADADQLFPRLPDREGGVYSALIPNERGYERARAAGATSIALVIAATDTLNRKNIGMTLDQALASAATVIRRARVEGVFVRAYVAAACGCPYEGEVAPGTVLDLTGRLFAEGAAEVTIADTIAAGHPAQVRDLFSAVVREHGAERLAGHFHDTRGLASALAWAALECGIRKFDSSIGGLGGCPFAPGAAGNLATEDLVFLMEKSGYDTGIDLPGLMPAVHLAEKLTGQPLGGRIRRWWEGEAARQQRAAS